MDCPIDFQPYLSSIRHDYAEWQKFYTLTDIEGKSKASSDQNKRVVSFDFGLMMQSVNNREPEASRQEKAEKPERRPVLDGLRNSLAEATHILLVGRPGSGKSTALARLLLEEAQQNQGDAGEKRIPVLVELRYYQTSVLDLIQDFFRRHNLVLEIHQVETLLSQNHLLLLVDGLNELPSEAARQDIVKLRNHRRVPIIFTTRDLSLGGDFSIEKQWEMLPLTELQMQEFIKSHLSSEQADAMWRQLKDRTRKFAETPLLLWMLCELFGQVEEIPHNLGEVFRVFTRAYENNSIRKHGVAALKGDVQPLSDRRLWFPALKHLAYRMMQGKTPVGFRTVISREEAKEELQALFSEEPHPDKTARDCLDDLLKYHLLQIRSGNEIEFRHQLFQEYYAAEWLLQQLPNLSDEQLKYYFLNYLKWTEPVALMLALVGKVQAMRVVELALEVDWILGAKLSGAVNVDLQENTISIVEKRAIRQKIPSILKIKILGETRSYRVINIVKQGFSPRNLDLFKYSVEALSKIDRNVAIEVLLNILSNGYGDMHLYSPSSGRFLSRTDRLAGIYSDARVFAVEMLAKVNPELAIERLSRLIAEDDLDPHVRWKAAETLNRIGSQAAIPFLLEELSNLDPDIRKSVAEGLGIIGSDQTVTGLLEALEDIDSDVRFYAAEALGMIGSPIAIPALISAMKDLNADVRASAAEALGQIGSDIAISALTQALNDSDEEVRTATAISLQKLGHNDAVEELTSDLIQDLNSKYLYTRLHAASALEYLGCEATVPFLLQALADRYPEVRSKAALALGAIGSNKAVTGLLEALEDKEAKVREHATIALGQINSHAALSYLIQRLDDQHSDVRCSAAKALGKLGSEEAVGSLIRRLKDPNSRVRVSAIEALGEISSITAVEDLMQQLTNDPATAICSVQALAEIGSPLALSHLCKLWLLRTKEYLSIAIATIQSRCKFYNYDIVQLLPPPTNFAQLSANGSPTYNFYGSVGNVANTVHRNQITNQQKDLKEEG